LDLEKQSDGVVRPKYEYEYCPVNYVTESELSLLQLFGFWKQNKMLVAGGIEDQPAKYVQAMSMLDMIFGEEERKAIEGMKGGQK
jgi:hypothetical protein